jgi:hypothetical protein
MGPWKMNARVAHRVEEMALETRKEGEWVEEADTLADQAEELEQEESPLVQ